MTEELTEADAYLDVAGVPDVELLDDIKALIVDAEAGRPRSQQRMLGPSEVGHRCERRLAHGLVNARRELPPEGKGLNRHSDPMAAILGTAAHAWMEDAARAANERLGRINWIPEQQVTVRPGLSGTADLYHVDSATVLDWKFPGATRYKKYSKGGPSNTYMGQTQLYGKGYRNLGLPVEKVGIIFVSRTGTMNQIHLWRVDYDEGAVDEILARIDRVEAAIENLDLENKPAGFKTLPITPDDDCGFCPWHSVNPQGDFQCGGAG